MKKHNIIVSSLKQIVIRLAGIGLDEDKIRYITGVNKSDFEKLKEDKSVRSALKNSAGINEHLVEQALLKCATGFQYEEVTLTPDSAKSGKNGNSPPAQKVTKKTVLPNASACIFWLKNRAPERWRDPSAISEKETLKEFIEKYGEE